MVQVTLLLGQRKGSLRKGGKYVWSRQHISGAACGEHRPRGDRRRGYQSGHAGQAIDVPTPEKRPPAAGQRQPGA